MTPECIDNYTATDRSATPKEGRSPSDTATQLVLCPLVEGELRHHFVYICGIVYLTDFEAGPHRFTRATRAAKARRSSTRRTARPALARTSSEGSTRSVNSMGTAQATPSPSTHTTRRPAALWDSPTLRSSFPVKGWNGWVTLTRCASATGTAAVRDWLQAHGDGSLPPPGAAAGRAHRAPGCHRPGHAVGRNRHSSGAKISVVESRVQGDRRRWRLVIGCP